jgi:hypothetical protein
VFISILKTGSLRAFSVPPAGGAPCRPFGALNKHVFYFDGSEGARGADGGKQSVVEIKNGNRNGKIRMEMFLKSLSC